MEAKEGHISNPGEVRPGGGVSAGAAPGAGLAAEGGGAGRQPPGWQPTGPGWGPRRLPGAGRGQGRMCEDDLTWC